MVATGRWKIWTRWILSVLFTLAGVMHFVSPRPYLVIMPPAVPWPLAMIYVSGIAEILGGLGIAWAPTRRAAAFGLIALLVAVFPANIYAARHGMNLSGWQVPAWLLWLRLPFQPALIALVYSACWKERKLPR